MNNNPKYWRIYYRIQEMLSEEFGYAYNSKGNIGGVREQSSLPEELNLEAKKIATYIINTHPEEIKEVEKKWDIVHTDILSFNTYVNELRDELRVFVNEVVIADNYYLVMDITKEEIYGGFATNENGTITGIFSLEKGMGKDIIKSAIEMAIMDSGMKVYSLKLTCIGDFLKELYLSFGFKVLAQMGWNNNDWDYNKFGTPEIYYMRKDI